MAWPHIAKNRKIYRNHSLARPVTNLTTVQDNPNLQSWDLQYQQTHDISLLWLCELTEKAEETKEALERTHLREMVNFRDMRRPITQTSITLSTIGEKLKDNRAT